MQRTQIYLDEAQTQELEQRSILLGTTRSELIRQAIDAYLSRPMAEDAQLEGFHNAVACTAGSIPRLDRGAEAVAASRRDDAARRDELDRQWQP